MNQLADHAETLLVGIPLLPFSVSIWHSPRWQLSRELPVIRAPEQINAWRPLKLNATTLL
jgi:hypothetical protein